MRRFVLAVLAVLLFGIPCFGQTQTGLYPFGTFDTFAPDSVNVGNLNSYFSLPVLSKPGRGQQSLYYNLVYNGSIWAPVSVTGSQTWTPVLNWGWTAATDAHTGYVGFTILVASTCTSGGKKVAYEVWGAFTYHDVLGVVHGFNGLEVSNNPACSGVASTAIGTTTDGSGYSLSVNAPGTTPAVTVTSVTGKVFTAPSLNMTGSGSTVDTNGNVISVNNSGQITDTTGQVALSISGTAPNPTTYTYKDTSGNPQTVTVNYTQYTVQTAFQCSGILEFPPTQEYLISSISYEDGETYSFTYEHTSPSSANYSGRLASITLPQGGTIDYTYTGSNNGIECSDGSAAGLTRSLNSDSGSAASTWTFTRSSGSGTSHTEVVDGLQNHLAYDFVIAGGATTAYYETNRNVYQGAEQGASVLTRQTCYNNAAYPCTTTPVTPAIGMVDTYETLNGVEMHGLTTKYNASGMPTEVHIHDFGGATSRGPLLSTEQWSYYSIPGLVTQDELFDVSNHEVANTVYTYDQGTPTASSGIPQHNSVTGPRGNLTSWSVNTNSSSTLGGTATYEDTGSVLTNVFNGATTGYSYDSTFIYNSSVTLPTPSSGVSISSSTTYDTSETGLPLTSTDPNTQVTHNSSYDSMLRPTEIDFPDGGKTILSYSATSLSQHTYQSSNVYSDTETEYDGYGRKSRVAVSNGQTGNSWYQQDTCYDANGNPSFSSYAYQSTGFTAAKVCSGSGDTYAYDVLGRVSTVTRANGESVSYTYTGRATKVIDENGATRISQVDGLGRQTILCEVSGSASPATCGTDIAGTASGFTTSFAYDFANHKTTISQGGQTRVFQTDWLGRPILVQEPESGQTTYSYAYNATGLVVTRQRPRANQTYSSVLTTTTTQYDSLGRVLTINYDDGTPTRTFTYDKSANWNSFSQAYPKGRLSTASVPAAGTAYSYDTMGRVASLDECPPSGCSTLGYTYDLAGNMTSSTDGGGATSTYTLSPANELQSITSSLNDSTHPPNLISSVTNGPNGPISYNLGNGMSSGYTYDTLGRLSGGWVHRTGAPAYCSILHGSGYRFASNWRGSLLTGSVDSVLGLESTYGYDEFDRLTSLTSTPAQNYTWTYDRWGNRTQQNALQGGFSPQYSFNASNQISGYAYDAAGNMTNDSFHTYTYDAEGNVTQVDGGATAQYTYNALNQRVRTVANGATTDFVINASGQRVSIWNGTNHSQIQGQYYWGTKPVAYYAGSATHFQHQDGLGTERMRTTYNGSVEGTFTSLPFGDGQATTSGTDGDAYHYAGLDYDTETNTHHAQFRQYNPTQGRWLSPDPYHGSYDASNPQSFNRYVYALNNPLSNNDPSGLDDCTGGGTNDDPIDASMPGRPRAADCDGGGGGGGGPMDPAPGPPETSPQPCDPDASICVTGTLPPDPLPEPIDPGSEPPGQGQGGPNIVHGGGGAPSNPAVVLVSNTPSSQDYFAAYCKGSNLFLTKHSCAYLCAAVEAPFAIPVVVPGTIVFKAKQIWSSCGSVGEMFCPSSVVVEGNYDPFTGVTSNENILSCNP